MDEVRTLHLSHLSRPLAFVGSRAVEEAFRSLLKGWQARNGAPADAEGAIVKVLAGSDGYRLECAWLTRSRRFAHAVDAACALIAELAQALLVERRELLCLHCGAVELRGTLVVLPGHYGVGKSVFAACCAARGHRIFADDVLPLGGAHSGDDHGRAPGFAPRLRLPLPNALSRQTRAFLDAHRGPASARYQYLDLGDSHLASFGEEARIGAFVLLDRNTEAEPRLVEVGVGEILRHVVARNFARDLPASTILDRLHRLVARCRRFRLSYASTEDAVRHLIDALPDPIGTAPPVDGALPQDARDASRPPTASPVPRGCYLRHPGVGTTEVDGEIFLTDPQDRSIHHLDRMAAGLWRLFARPTSVAEALSILRAAFPDLSSRQCEADLQRLTHRMRQHDLLLWGDEPPS